MIEMIKHLKHLIQENQRLTTEVDKQKTDIENKEAELEKSHQVMETWETQMVAFREQNEQNSSKQKHYHEALVKYLTQLEEKIRKEKRIWLNEQQIRLGRLTT